MINGAAAVHGFDVRTARILTVLAAILFPLTIPLYLAAWILLPEAPAPGRAPADVLRGGLRTWLAIGLVIAAFLIFFDGGWGWGWDGDGNLVAAALLLGLGVWLWSRRSPDAPAPASTAPGPSLGPRPYAQTSPYPYPPSVAYPPASVGAYPPPGAAAPWPYPAPASVPPRAPRPLVGRVTFAAALVGLGLAFVGDRLGWYDLDLAAAFGVLLGVVGLGIVAGAFLGAGRGLIVPAVLLAGLAFSAAAVGGIRFGGPYGEREVRPITIAEVRDGYEHGIGKYTVDLRDLDWDGGVLDVPIDMGIGELVVLVPPSTDLEVVAEVGAGQVDALERRASGTSLEERFNFDDPAATRTLHLDIDLSLGHVVVERPTAATETGRGT